jgi:antirestriction protein ArdC
MAMVPHIEKPYQVMTDRILSLLEQGTVPWQKPWNAEHGQPCNLFTQRTYSGLNVLLLSSMGYASPFWCTFNQAKAAGGRVRKGEHGTPVVFWRVYDGKANEEGTREKRFALQYFTVFNAEQLDGVALPPITFLG